MSDAETSQREREDQVPEWEGVARDLLAGKLEMEHNNLGDALHPIVGALERDEEISPRDVDELYSQLDHLKAVLHHVERATPGRTPAPPLEEFVDHETLQAYSEAIHSPSEERR